MKRILWFGRRSLFSFGTKVGGIIITILGIYIHISFSHVNMPRDAPFLRGSLVSPLKRCGFVLEYNNNLFSMSKICIEQGGLLVGISLFQQSLGLLKPGALMCQMIFLKNIAREFYLPFIILSPNSINIVVFIISSALFPSFFFFFFFLGF